MNTKQYVVLVLSLVITGTALATGALMQHMGGRHMGNMGMMGRHMGMMNVVPNSYQQLKNPIPSTAENIAAGSKNYQSNCSACHGQSGKGDGPAANGLSPRPANLKQLMRNKRASDGYLMWTISQGRRAMPAFNQTLSEEERWQIIRFLRTL